ncbi:cytochrome b [Antarcticirhabdus aurantiaca]|uniref:Cytochrome b/b6 domain-containing protein n=1 Tax=Antarcticirhabdus aurantiaca TaxID=2606717 RepID=A0ACD4NS93_9HYPH|nr:cytochrome b/b6 domain-containing protein [Antarcticirhabdus aurantiaca]WAJ29664.1 cytochrome b/b6 domain-containing protein [Jeongeuplla avenae]
MPADLSRIPAPSAPSAGYRPDGWTRLHVVLHWLVVALVAVQFVDKGSMEALFDATFEGHAISGTDAVLGWAHIVCGSAILAAMAVRLVDRVLVGRPAYDPAEPAAAVWLARATHGLLYAVLLAMPALGLLAWITGLESYADLHTALWTPLLVLLGLHVVGALVQHLVFKTNALRNMTSLKRRAQ